MLSARLKIRSTSSPNNNRIYMSAYPALADWHEATLTWADRPAYGDPFGWAWLDTPPPAEVAPKPGQVLWATFKLDPSVIAGWLLDPCSNLGIFVNGEGSPREVEYSFSSREGPNPAIHPQLVIE